MSQTNTRTVIAICSRETVDQTESTSTPEKHLLAYVLDRAVRDLDYKLVGKFTTQGVIRWFTNYDYGVVPFCDVAAYLELSKDRLEAIRNRVAVVQYQLGLKKCGEEVKLGI